VNLFEGYCRQVSFIVIVWIHTFVDVGAVSFPVDFSSLLLLITLIRLSPLTSFLCCFSAVDSLSRSLGGSGSRKFAGSGSGL
jgi:hypothetical protein